MELQSNTDGGTVAGCKETEKVCSGGGPSLATWKKSMVTVRVAQMPLKCSLKNGPHGYIYFSQLTRTEQKWEGHLR